MASWADYRKIFPFLTESLQNARKHGRMAHSFLIDSTNPDHRLEFPTLLAMLAACENITPEGAPCEKCDTCRQLRNGVFPDLYLLAPTSKSREILVGKDDDEPDTLRNFQHNFYLGSSTASGWKIGIVQNCDAMNSNAQNAFLKTLEEPPEKCLFILATGRMRSMLPTIRSRCQLLALTDNSCKYDLSLFPGIAETLRKLAAANTLLQAEDAAVELIAILKGLDEKAQSAIEAKWASRFEEAQTLESAGVKLLEKRRDGEIKCEYLRLREQFTSILHAFFAQLALLADGQPQDILPNPELLEPYLKNGEPPLKMRKALRLLTAAEKLCDSLRTNVNDALVVRAFALNAALKK